MKSVLSSVVFIGALLAGMAAWAGPVNINQANAKMLAKELVGVGPAKAQAIVNYRKAHGPFKSAADLKKVKGIGTATIAKNKANILLKGHGMTKPQNK
jgi:competence protein ComEA